MNKLQAHICCKVRIIFLSGSVALYGRIAGCIRVFAKAGYSLNVHLFTNALPIAIGMKK